MNDDIVAGFDDEQDDNLEIRLQKIETTPGCLDTYHTNGFQKRVTWAIGAGFTQYFTIKENLMSMIENDVVPAILRSLRRDFERQMIAGIRTIRLELELLAKQDRIEELEASEWAHLEPLE